MADVTQLMPLHLAQTYLNAVDNAVKALQQTAFPACFVKDGALHCPYCKRPVDTHHPEVEYERRLVLIDFDTRWNYAYPVVEEQVVEVREGEKNYEDLVYRVDCCEAPVSLPEGWDASW